MAEYSKKATKLLRTLIDVVALRSNNKKRKKYQGQFKDSDTFLVAKIKGEVEFIPASLLPDQLGKRSKKVQELLDEVFGDPKSNPALDERLSEFYKKHNLKRDLNAISDTIHYYLKPKPESAPKKVEVSEMETPDFFSAKAIKKCAPYANQAYLASDPNLQKIGNKFGQSIVAPTNYWLRALNIAEFDIEPERYWQVAGMFKSFTWGKLFKPGNKDKRVFFSIGVDVANGELFYNLDCQRTGSNKLGRDHIARFDYFLQSKDTSGRIKLKKLEEYDWEKLITESRAFIEKNEALYDEVVAYLWDSEVNIKHFKNKLIEVRSVVPAGDSPPENSSPDKNHKKLSLLALNFEKDMLLLMGKEDLAKRVRLMPNKKFDLLSYTVEGGEKWIKIKASPGTSPHHIEVTRKEIAESKNTDKNVYLYCIFDYAKGKNAGKLLIRKGDFSRFLKLQPTTYSASFKR